MSLSYVMMAQMTSLPVKAVVSHPLVVKVIMINYCTSTICTIYAYDIFGQPHLQDRRSEDDGLYLFLYHTHTHTHTHTQHTINYVCTIIKMDITGYGSTLYIGIA